MKEITTKETVIYDGKIMTVKLHDVIANGIATKREIVHKGGAVAIVPINNNGNVVTVRQYRIAVEEELLEIPAGLMDPGEEPLETAKRELKEETGYTAEKWTHMTEFYPTAGFCNEYIHIFLAEGLTPGETSFDETENIEMEEYSMEELLEMINTGEIHDGKTVAGIALAKLLR
ncbi:MAG: NUDIX hydrolase [Clostridiales bacterium]|nr:NUDIX hydrolase [Clostridiales bacterium]